MSNNRFKREEKKPLPEGTENKTRVIVGNLELLQVQLLSDISAKLDKLIEKK